MKIITKSYNIVRKLFIIPDVIIHYSGERIAVRKSDNGNYGILYKAKNSNGYYKNPFVLKINEYGRIIYNERNIGGYTGIWYYYLVTYNFINCDKSGIREKMFFRKVPDYKYKDMNYLRYC